RIERNEQVLCPLETVAAFPDAMIDKEIIKNRRAEHAVLPSQLADRDISALCQPCCFFRSDARRKGGDLLREGVRGCQIAARHLQRGGALFLLGIRNTGPQRENASRSRGKAEQSPKNAIVDERVH